VRDAEEQAQQDTTVEDFRDFMARADGRHGEFTPERIWNMDETRLYWDMPPTRTIHYKNGGRVVVQTSKYSKAGFSVVLTCAKDGSMLPPLIIFKGSTKGTLIKTVPAAVRAACGDSVRVCFRPEAGMNEQVMLNEYHSLAKDQAGDRDILLVMDALNAHRTDAVKELYEKSKLHLCIIPAGHTSLLQHCSYCCYELL